MANFLIMRKRDLVPTADTTHRITTKNGHEVGFIFKSERGWLVWSEENYFRGAGNVGHPSLQAALIWVLGVVQLPIIIDGGKTNDTSGPEKRAA